MKTSPKGSKAQRSPIENVHRYGHPPYAVAVIHGGPGANGEMAPVAERISDHCGVLEPLQMAMSVDDLVEELASTIMKYGTTPMTLIGHSWGAWLAYLFAAKHPTLVQKIILVASPPFLKEGADKIDEVRLSRLSDAERILTEKLWQNLSTTSFSKHQTTTQTFLHLLTKADSYNPVYQETSIDFRFDIFQKVWPEAAAMRESGELLRLGQNIICPAVAIHGDYDPHPSAGVQAPLSKVMKDFRFILLKHCGHRPWIEKDARDEFYRVLIQELRP